MSNELEQLIRTAQMHNEQLQGLMIQKQTLLLQSKEIEKALEEITDTTDDIYRSVGPILIKTAKEKLQKDLENDKEEAELKVKTIENQEKKLQAKIKEITDKLQTLMPAGQGG